MDTAPWIPLVQNEITARNQEFAPSAYNIDDLIETVCIKDHVWRFHSELEAWVYAQRKIHDVLYFMRDVFVYKVYSDYSNTFCFSVKRLKRASEFDWECIYSSKPNSIAEIRMTETTRKRKTSMDLSSVMERIRQKRRSSSLPSQKLLKGLKT